MSKIKQLNKRLTSIKNYSDSIKTLLLNPSLFESNGFRINFKKHIDDLTLNCDERHISVIADEHKRDYRLKRLLSEY